MSEYFQCIVPEMTSNVAGNSSCSCPKPCHQSIYSPVLSYAKLSTLKLGNTQPLLDQYYPALEVRQRLEPEIFTSDITMYQRLLTHSTELTSFIEEYTSGSQSMLSRIWDCGTAILTEALEQDINLQFVNMKSYSNAMQKVFGQSLEVHKNNAEDLYTKLDQLIVATKMYLPGELGNTTIRTLIQDASVISNIQYVLTRTLLNLMSFPENLTLTYDISPEHFPQTFYRDEILCLNSIVKYILNIFQLLSDLTSYERPGVDYSNVIQNSLNLLKTEDEQIDNCFSEITTLLENIQSWIDLSLKSIADLIDTSNPISITNIKGINQFKNSQEEISNEFMAYKSGAISKLELLQNTFPSGTLQMYSTGTANVVQGVNTNQLDAIKEYANDIFESSVEIYSTLMKHTVDLSWYFEISSLYRQTSSLIIWKKPQANFEYPMQIRNEGGELWQIESVLRDILTPYKDSMLNEISKFEFQLNELETSIHSDLQVIENEYNTYRESRELNTMFIQTNFLEVDIYFRELKYQTVKQFRSYGIADLFGDIGGYMGLLLGASALTVIELLDLIFYNGIRKLYDKRPNQDDDDDESKTTEDNNGTHSKGYNNNAYGNWNYGHVNKNGDTGNTKL